MSMTRRDLLKATAAGAVLTGVGLPVNPVRASDKVVRIGFNAPLTGPVAGWGLPGLHGCKIWAEQINDAGGIQIGDKRYQVEFVAFDNEYSPSKALQGWRRQVLEQDVKMIMMLGGDTWPGVQRFANQAKMLASTLLPSDLNPDAPYLVAPSETHPIYNVTGVQWLADNHPNAKSVAICAQNDSLGKPSVATYLAAFKAAGIEVKDVNFFDMGTTDFAPIVTSMMDKEPDILCWDTAYPDFVKLLTQQAYSQGFDGKIISCTCDNYEQIVEKTSKEFMEGFVFQFPDFDDPALDQDFINFPDPGEFYQKYTKRYPGEWTAVSWEYAAIGQLWKSAAENSGSAEPLDVFKQMQKGNTAPHVFGEASWWGEELWGKANALVGKWPVVTIEDGKATIQGFYDIRDWMGEKGNLDLLIKEMEKQKLMYYQG